MFHHNFTSSHKNLFIWDRKAQCSLPLSDSLSFVRQIHAMARKRINFLIPLLLLASVSADRKPVCKIALENIKLAPGEETTSKIKCSMYSCVKNGTGATLKIKSCLLRPLQPGCRYTEERLGWNFPHCCPLMLCDPTVKEDDYLPNADHKISQPDLAFNLTSVEGYSGVVETYQLNQKGLSKCIDSTGKVSIAPGKHYEDKKRCLYYSCVRKGNTLTLRVASCFNKKPGRGCHKTAGDSSKSFPKCCPVTICKHGSRESKETIEEEDDQSQITHKSSQKCYIWNQHLVLSQGDQVEIKGGCGLYTCLGNGKLQISGCTKSDLGPGCYYSEVDLGKPFPRCCPRQICLRKTHDNVAELSEKCVVREENLFLAVGQTLESTKKCAQYTCLSCGKIQTSSCVRKPLPAGCRYSPGNMDKSFPSCCPVVTCKPQHRDHEDLQNRFQPYMFGLQNSIFKESDIDIGVSGSNTVNTEILAHLQIKGLAPNVCFSPDNNLNIPVGTVVKVKGKCAQYSCDRNGNQLELKYFSCSKKAIPPGCYQVNNDLNNPFPYCCPITRCESHEVIIVPPTKCVYPEGNITLKEGEVVNDESLCAQYSCVRVGSILQLRQKSCDLNAKLPSGCHYTKADKMKPFPRCCPSIECHLVVHPGRSRALDGYLGEPEDLESQIGYPEYYLHRHRRQVDVLAETGGKCYVPKENVRLSAGEQIKAKGQCVLYSCDAEGGRMLLKTYRCSKLPPLRPGCRYDEKDVNSPFPQCCTVFVCRKNKTEGTIKIPKGDKDTAGKCYHEQENLLIPLGQVAYGKGKCERYSCTSVGATLKLKVSRCNVPKVGNCTIRPGNPSQRFPGCCPIKECVHNS